MFSKLMQKYRSLKPGTQHKLTLAGIVGAVASLIVLGSFFSSSDKHEKVVNINAGAKKEALSLDNKILEKTVTAQNDTANKEIEDLKKRIEDLQKGNGQTPNTQQPAVQSQPGSNTNLSPLDRAIAMNQQKQPQANSLSSNQNSIQRNMNMAQTSIPRSQKVSTKSLPPLPPVPDSSQSASTRFSQPPPPSGTQGAYYPQASDPPPVPQTMGKIGHAENDAIKTAKGENTSEGKKKEKNMVYLPPSFMQATLLSGLVVPTAEGAEKNPRPAIIRIKAPAQLPNEVRGNLKGCFVIAESVASLADERAQLRLVSLSCLSKKGQSVIDQEITGFVQDADGSIGLSGIVVSKFGAALARSMLAGFVEGIGNAVASSATTTSISPLGQTQALNTSSLKNIGLAGLGGGISTAAKEIQKFYLDLAKNSMPVLVVGNGKKITLVVSKGVNLEIKNYKTVPWY